MCFQIQIFRNTIINWLIPASIIIAVGIVSFLMDFKNYKRTYQYSGIGLYFYSSMHYIIGFGFIACSIFMLVNYYFADQNVKTESYEIIDRYELGEGGGRKISHGPQPAFIINYKGKEKELIFYSQYLDKMDFYKTVEFDIREGFFGFDILENKKLN